MSTILDKIIAQKKIEIEQKKQIISQSELENSEYFGKPTHSLFEALSNKIGIIAEIKRCSPSKNIINNDFPAELGEERTKFVQNLAKGYADASAIGLSILTDKNFFSGDDSDVIDARKVTNIPILRKEFIIDEYQIWEAKAMGADVILLIASCLTISKTKYLAQKATDLGLEVLLEVHTKEEINFIDANTELVGVNNRNLHTFEININNSLKLVEEIPNEVIKISESGLNSLSDLHLLIEVGFRGFLMGESFMKTENPAAALQKITKRI
ncbi:MAG: indole-3-glycerol phosphate synthase TrpC [Bacteroidetes bacterium]|nr:MAG: indole-3-glycerol phosphate synthase TrpC [Bacteroidota bacterium]TAG87143.1 MAG: indole-3-glycerol phosphate synthase TrpC [Bacteroidota bacterium]